MVDAGSFHVPNVGDMDVEAYGEPEEIVTNKEERNTRGISLRSKIIRASRAACVRRSNSFGDFHGVRTVAPFRDT